MSRKNHFDLSAFDSKEKILESVGLLRGELQTIKLQMSLDNSGSKGRVREIRKNIARLLTKLNSLN